MLPFLLLSVLLLGTCLASPHAMSVNDEINNLKERLDDLDKKVTYFGNGFITVHRARSFASGSEKLYTTNNQEGNFEVASATCIHAGGHIPSPKKEGENKALQSVLERRNKSAFIVGDNSADFANWAPGEPNNSDGTTNCWEADKDGKWRAASCEEKHLIVCEFSFVP